MPTLKDGEVVVSESLAAVIYLAETYDSGSQLLPASDAPAARALVCLQGPPPDEFLNENPAKCIINCPGGDVCRRQLAKP